MQRINSGNDNTCSVMADLIRNRYRDPGVGDFLMGNDELLRRMGRHVESLLCTKNVDAALAVAKEMTFMVPASSTGALYERLITNYKRLSDKMDQAAVSMATLNESTPKIDFISTLPFDIVSKVVNYLWGMVSNMHVTPTFLYVSKQWRKTILESIPFLSYRLLPATQYDREKTALSHASRIRAMTIRGSVVSFSQLLGTYLVNLQRLCIHVPRPSPSCTMITGSYFPGRRIAVWCPYNLDDVMECCPHLISLKWSGSPLKTRNEKRYETLRILKVE